MLSLFVMVLARDMRPFEKPRSGEGVTLETSAF